MSNIKLWRKMTHALIAASLIAPQVGLAAPAGAEESKWLFPGSDLPKDIGHRPMQVGDSADSDVQAKPRDWFLLEERNEMLPHVAKSNQASNSVPQILRFHGPILDNQNAQSYFKITAGMILQESLKQMGMSPMEAKRYMDLVKENGVDFDKASVEEMRKIKGAENLPNVIDDLYSNFDQPMKKMADLPYMLLPLAVAYNGSHLQHFYAGTFEGPANRSCETAKTVAPIGFVQLQIDEKERALTTLETELRTSIALLEQSNNEITRLTNFLEELNGRVANKQKCLNAVTSRVDQGDAMPSAECLDLAAKVLADAGESKLWERMLSKNLKNEKGDYSVKVELEIKLENLKARLKTQKDAVVILLDAKAKQEAILNEQSSTLGQLDSDKSSDQQNIEILNAELAQVNEQKKELILLDQKLQAGTLTEELPTEEVAALNAQTVERKEQIMALTEKSKVLSKQIDEKQVSLAGNSTQVEYTAQQAEAARKQIEALDQQLGDENSGLLSVIAKLETEVAKTQTELRAATDEYSFAQMAIVTLKNDLSMISQERDESFKKLQFENDMAASYQERITKAQEAKNANAEQFVEEITGLNQLLSYYRSDDHMGWFMEDNCESRKMFDKDGAGIYLARAPLTTDPGEGQVSGGRWGLFNMDYKAFQTDIDQGLLLDVQETVKVAVREIFGNYDYAIGEILDPMAQVCSEAAQVVTLNSLIPTVMRSAFSIWDEGRGEAAKSKGYCALSTDPATEKGRANAGFNADLTDLLIFTDSFLDQVLPKEGQSSAKDQIERKALNAIAEELSISAGFRAVDNNSTQAMAKRRSDFVKALIKVLATDHVQAIKDSTKQMANANKYRFATEAPRRSVRGSKDIVVGETYRIETTGQVPLYSEPVAEAKNETGESVSWTNEVTVLEPANASFADALEAGWVFVSHGNAKAWMPVWAITYGQLVGADGQEIFDLGDDSKCPVRRVVTDLNNFMPDDLKVTRTLKPIDTVEVKGLGVFRMVWNPQNETTPAAPNKTYVACELFQNTSGNGEIQKASTVAFANEAGVDYTVVQGIKIIEVKVIRAENGETKYLPIESEGGYVHTWIHDRNMERPRILLGPKLDPETWSVK